MKQTEHKRSKYDLRKPQSNLSKVMRTFLSSVFTTSGLSRPHDFISPKKEKKQNLFTDEQVNTPCMYEG